jgi:hypothetical protein
MTGGYYDLHIHSCLSPCASDDMTPANIAGMASLKQLSFIALTDHNCGRNLPAMARASAEYGLVFLPGIEVTTAEEVHVLTYFRDVKTALDFGNMVYASLPDITNRPEIFGRQIVMSENDEPVCELPKLLLQATPFSIEDVDRRAQEAGGCAIPAHVNRASFSVLANLGFMPPGLFRAAEVSPNLPCPPLDDALYILHSSDAHNLGDISEPINLLSNIHNPSEFIDFILNFGTN